MRRPADEDFIFFPQEPTPSPPFPVPTVGFESIGGVCLQLLRDDQKTLDEANILRRDGRLGRPRSTRHLSRALFVWNLVEPLEAKRQVFTPFQAGALSLKRHKKSISHQLWSGATTASSWRCLEG